MKVFNIMMFLLIFNVVISLVGYLHIYNMEIVGQSPNSATLEDLSNPSNADKEDSGGAIWLFLGPSAYALFLGSIAGAVGGYYLLRVPTAEGAAYGFFASLIGIIFINSYRVLWSIVNFIPDEQVRAGASVIVGLFLAICGVLFAFGFLQLVRGGIEHYV